VANLIALGQTGPHADGQIFEQTDRAQDFQAIGQALQSGDLAGAETAYTALASTFGNPITGGKQPSPVSPPVFQPPVVLGPPVSQPPGTSSVPEIVINLGGASGTGTSSGSAAPELIISLQGGNSASTASASTSSATPELVINLAQAHGTSSSNPEEIAINLGGNGGGQVSISSRQGSNAEQFQINLNQLSNNELILNLFNSNAASQAQSSSTGLSVQA